MPHLRDTLRAVIPTALAILLAAVPVVAGTRHFHEIRAERQQLVVVPLGDTVFPAGSNLVATLDRGLVEDATLLSACGPAVNHARHPGLLPAFGLVPASGQALNPMSSAVSRAVTSNRLYVERDAAPLSPEFVANLAEQDTTAALGMGDAFDAATGTSAGQGCFSWLQLRVDARGLPSGTLLIVKLDTYAPGVDVTTAAPATLHLPAARVL